MNSSLNQGFRLPGGDQFHVNLEFTDNPADAHTTVEVGDSPTDQTHWNPNTTPAVLAHETLHYLGVPDEYDDDSRVFLEKTSRSGVHLRDGGMMGKDVLQPGGGLRPRHLWLVERTANSQVAVPDTRLDTPGTSAPASRSVPSTDTRPAPDGVTTTPAAPTRPASAADVAGPSTEASPSGVGTDSDASQGQGSERQVDDAPAADVAGTSDVVLTPPPLRTPMELTLDLHGMEPVEVPVPTRTPAWPTPSPRPCA